MCLIWCSLFWCTLCDFFGFSIFGKEFNFVLKMVFNTNLDKKHCFYNIFSMVKHFYVLILHKNKQQYIFQLA